MKSLLVRASAVVVCVAVCGTAIADDTFRCGSRLVEIGMTQSEVLGMCGNPTSKATEVQDVRSGNQVVGKTEVQRWTYKSYSAVRVLVFDKDTLKSIE
jgi:hypothetical protein